MDHLVPLKVCIGLRDNGHADHPDFNKLPAKVRGNTDWSYYIDRFAEGWKYDKVCGHADTDLGNPDVPDNHEHRNDEIGCQFGCILVPEAFAEAAVKEFPKVCEIISEESFECFYDDRACAHLEEEEVDLDALQRIKARIDAGDNSAKTKQNQKDALDATHPRRGVRRNHRKTWASFKALRQIVIREKERKA